MKKILILIFCVLSTAVKCQLTVVKCKNNTDEIISMEKHDKEFSSWIVSDNEISWKYYNEDGILLLNNTYSVISKNSDENSKSVYYIARKNDGSTIKFQFWILGDESKCVTVGSLDTYTNYFGNVSFNINL